MIYNDFWSLPPSGWDMDFSISCQFSNKVPQLVSTLLTWTLQSELNAKRVNQILYSAHFQIIPHIEDHLGNGFSITGFNLFHPILHYCPEVFDGIEIGWIRLPSFQDWTLITKIHHVSLQVWIGAPSCISFHLLTPYASFMIAMRFDLSIQFLRV